MLAEPIPTQPEPATLRCALPRALGCLLDPPLGSVRYRVAYGGRGSAKSWSMARAILILCLSRTLRVLCAREYQASIKASVHTLLADQIDQLGLRDLFQVDQTSIRSHNGSEILFAGVRRDPHSIKSLEGIDLCWIEEAESVSKTSWEILIPTVRKPGSEIWISFNPRSPNDPVWQRFIADPVSSSIVKRVSWQDNPWLPDVLRLEREELLRRDPELEAHVWGGEPWARSDEIVLAGKWTVEDLKPEDDWTGPYFGADWGFARDPTVLVRCWIAGPRLVIDRDERGIGWSMDEIARRFKRVDGADKHTIRADSARPETIAEQNRRGLRVVAADKWPGSVEDGIEHLRGYEQIVIHPACDGLINEARLWRYAVDSRTGDVLPRLVPGNEHGWDAVRYALAPIIKPKRSFGVLA